MYTEIRRKFGPLESHLSGSLEVIEHFTDLSGTCDFLRLVHGTMKSSLLDDRTEGLAGTPAASVNRSLRYLGERPTSILWTSKHSLNSILRVQFPKRGVTWSQWHKVQVRQWHARLAAMVPVLSLEVLLGWHYSLASNIITIIKQRSESCAVQVEEACPTLRQLSHMLVHQQLLVNQHTKVVNDCHWFDDVLADASDFLVISCRDLCRAKPQDLCLCGVELQVLGSAP